jgi:GNAT superfamily N-acetyltransferase
MSQIVMRLKFTEIIPAQPVANPYCLERIDRQSDPGEWAQFLCDGHSFPVRNPAYYRGEILSSMIGGAVVRHRGKIVSFCAVCAQKQEPYALLMYLFTDPLHRCTGLGKAVLVDAIRIAQQANYPGIMLRTDHHRIDARSLFHSLGFVLVSDEKSS